jgi:hypothetical protein
LDFEANCHNFLISPIFLTKCLPSLSTPMLSFPFQLSSCRDSSEIINVCLSLLAKAGLNLPLFEISCLRLSLMKNGQISYTLSFSFVGPLNMQPIFLNFFYRLSYSVKRHKLLEGDAANISRGN